MYDVYVVYTTAVGKFLITVRKARRLTHGDRAGLVGIEDGKHQLDQKLLLLFKGLARLNPGEKKLTKEPIQEIMLKHDAKRWASRASG